ncbi:MAG: zinc-finger domain-containing protein [Arenicellales bacterium WSBS_2016_MAG_OTU3]
MSDANSTAQKTANADLIVHVTQSDLPLRCPMEGAPLWDSHPRVFLPIEESGEELCPYCGTRFILRRK